jgi:hypothetical protein
VTRVQPEGPVSKILQPGDKILQVNPILLPLYSIEHKSVQYRLFAEQMFNYNEPTTNICSAESVI